MYDELGRLLEIEASKGPWPASNFLWDAMEVEIMTGFTPDILSRAAQEYGIRLALLNLAGELVWRC